MVGNITKTAEILNSNGFRIDDRLIEGKEVSKGVPPAKRRFTTLRSFEHKKGFSRDTCKNGS